MILRFAMSAECFLLHHVPSCLVVPFVAVSNRNLNTVFSFSFSGNVIRDFGAGKLLCCVVFQTGC